MNFLYAIISVVCSAGADNYTVGHKNVPLYFCSYLRQLLTDFKNSFTGTLCRQFAVM